MDTLKEIPWQAEKSAFEAIAQIGSYDAMSEEDRNRYDDALRNYRDSIAVYEAAKNEGREEGREEGIVLGKQNVARTMITEGMDDAIIAKCTQLSIEEIHKLRNC